MTFDECILQLKSRKDVVDVTYFLQRLRASCYKKEALTAQAAQVLLQEYPFDSESASNCAHEILVSLFQSPVSSTENLVNQINTMSDNLLSIQVVPVSARFHVSADFVRDCHNVLKKYNAGHFVVGLEIHPEQTNDLSLTFKNTDVSVSLNEFIYKSLTSSRSTLQ